MISSWVGNFLLILFWSKISWPLFLVVFLESFSKLAENGEKLKRHSPFNTCCYLAIDCKDCKNAHKWNFERVLVLVRNCLKTCKSKGFILAYKISVDSDMLLCYVFWPRIGNIELPKFSLKFKRLNLNQLVSHQLYFLILNRWILTSKENTSYSMFSFRWIYWNILKLSYSQ